MHTKYLIYTLRAKEILQNGADPAGKNSSFRFTVNLSSSGLLDTAKVLSCDYHDDNALFYQIAGTLSPSDCENSELLLKDKIVFLDFEDVFTDPANDLSPALADLFDPSIGLVISFDRDNSSRFVPFDKSNSMARDYRITFIQSEIKEQIDERLKLGIDFTSFPVNLSKYYSYRGLYLSTGYRIDPLVTALSKESVVVVPDARLEVAVDNVFTVKDLGKTPYEFVQRSMDLPINPFDGEGIISPLLSKKINECLFNTYGIKKETHSFQIRLPFTKGMLHEVDFHQLIREVFGIDPKEIVIKDVFGMERCLQDAQIILTESMFKCTKWIKNHMRNNPKETDPMAFYFEQFHRFDHALYVTNFDSRLSNNGRVRLNHQFLSTMDLQQSEFADIVQDYIDGIDGTARLLEKCNTDAIGSESDGPDTDTDDPELTAQFSGNAIAESLRLNKGFLRDYKVNEIIKSIERGLEDNLALAKIEVSGEQRFLSGDLYSLIIHVLKQSTARINLEPYRSKSIKSGCFFMPSEKTTLEPGHNYVFLRNPHLSRNEQCILRYSSAHESIYQKYFSHLCGVVMVSYDSIVPMALSGADFDGDLVKIIYDRRVLDSVLRSCYIKKDGGIKRKLPVVVIQAPGGKDCTDNGSIPVKTVIDTFSNKVGIISNMAVKYAELAYSGMPDQDQNKCAECTIVTGLEIDAAKNGKHPSENIEQLKNGVSGIKSIFLDFKKDYLELRKEQYFCPKAIIENGMGTLCSSGKSRKEIKNIPVYSDTYEGSALSLVPGTYLSYLCNKKEKSEKRDKNQQILFRFESDQQWKAKLDGTIRDEVRVLIEAYSAVRMLERNIRDFRSKYGKSSFVGYINTLIDMKFDDHYQKMTGGISIEEAVFLAKTEIEDCVHSTAAAEAAIKRLSSEAWHFTTQDDFDQQLSKILGLTNISVLSDTTRTLLYDFRHRGYMLLYYFLQEVKTRFMEEIDVEDWDDRDCKYKDHDYFIAMKADLIQRDGERQTSSVCESSRRQICRRILSDLFGGNYDQALKYVYAYPAGSKRSLFLWNIFDANEILPNIMPGGIEDAG